MYWLGLGDRCSGRDRGEPVGEDFGNQVLRFSRCVTPSGHHRHGTDHIYGAPTIPVIGGHDERCSSLASGAGGDFGQLAIAEW